MWAVKRKPKPTRATSGQGCSQVPHAAAGMTVETTPEFVNSLGGPGFLDDCYITVEEYNSNANAQALVDAFIATQAATLGIPASSIAVSGISTDDDDVMGCSTTGRSTTGRLGGVWRRRRRRRPDHSACNRSGFLRKNSSDADCRNTQRRAKER